MNAILETLKKLLINIIIGKILTKENVEKWINEAMDKALECAKKSPAEWDDPIVQKLHDIISEILERKSQ
jgi:hypothetical protein